MSGTKKAFLWTTGIVGALLVVLLVILVFLPYFITLEPVRQKIIAGISRHIDGRFVFQKADFSFFPRPRIVIHQAQVSIPEILSASAEGITIDPQIIPLLQGKVRISLIKLDTPAATLELPGKRPDIEKSIPFPSAIIQGQLSLLLKLLESEAPQLTVEVENGRLNLGAEKQPVFWFQNIQGQITLPPDQLRIDLTCKSNLWENISIAARLRSKDLKGNANIQVTELHSQELLNHLAPATPLHLGDSRGNFDISLEVERGQTFRGKIQASSASLTFQRGAKRWSVKGITLSAALQIEGEKATISLAELNLQNPRARLGGDFYVDFAAPLFRMELAGREIDVAPVREIAMGLSGKTEPTQTIFDVLREGNLPYVSFKTHGRSPADLGELKNISVQGNLVGGRIFLSESLTGLNDINFDLRQVRGEILISQGIMEGQKLSAQWGDAKVFQGILKLGLKGGDAPFHLEALADADLAPLPPFLNKIIGNHTFSEEMKRFQELQGRSRGRLTLGETLKSIQPRIEIEEMSLSARYDRIPFPVMVESVQGGYDGEKISVQNLKGSIGQSSFKEISAQISLGTTPYLVVPSGRGSIATDEFFSWLTSIERFKVPLQDIKSMKGNLTLSSLNLNGPLTQPEKWDCRIEGEIGTLVARYTPIPYPLQVEKARVSFDGKKMNFRNLNGAMGKSIFSQISAQITLGESPYIAIPSGKSSIVVEEIFSWLTSMERFKVPLQEIKSLKGALTLSSIDVKGPLLQPEKWDYRIVGEIEKLTLEASAMPGPIILGTAKLEVTPDKYLLQDSQINFLDAALKFSASGGGWQEGWGSFDGTFQGNLGTKVIEWASARFQLPGDIQIRAPFSISQARLGWDRNKQISFNGNCQWPTGSGASVDLIYTPEAFTVNRLLITDERSRADIGLRLHQRDLRLDFMGNLEKTTVDQILTKNEFLTGSIRGDFHSHLFLDNLLRSTAGGKLAGTGLRLALPIKPPLILDGFSLEADQKKIRVQAADLTWEERHLAVEGSFDFLPEALLLDINVSIDGLKWECIENFLKNEDRKAKTMKGGQTDRELKASNGEEMQFPPLQGRIGVKSPYFEYERYTWRPLEIEITFPPEEVKVTITAANVCGISTTGAVRVITGGMAVDFHALAKDQEFSSNVQCLLGKPSTASGTFNFDGRFRGRGQPKDLVQSLQGPWQIDAKNGRLYHGSLILEILSFLSLEELFTKDKADLTKGNLSYKTFQAKGDLGSGTVFIKELAMNSPGMHLFSQGEIDLLNQRADLVVAVAPLKTADWIVSHIPIVGYILGGTLVSIPVKVKGNLYEPTIIPLDPAEIGLEFLGVMKRTLNAPIQFIRPIFKDLEKSERNPSGGP
jgi:hypothetical protein